MLHSGLTHLIHFVFLKQDFYPRVFSCLIYERGYTLSLRQGHTFQLTSAAVRKVRKVALPTQGRPI